MRNSLNSILGILAASAVGCLPVNSVQWAREPLPDASTCVVEIEEPDRKVKVTERSRRACVAMAQIVEPEVPRLSIEALKAGPPSERPFRSDEQVYCRYVPRVSEGGSLKFRCMRTDEKNRLYDDEGKIVPEAATFDADGVLMDTKGEPVVDDEGKSREGDELRVKYFLGSTPSARHREMFTETFASHFLWALGIPVDRVYMPASVSCFGCGSNPNDQVRPDSTPSPGVFRLASIERRYEGKRINVDRRRGWMGFGGGYSHGFALNELEGLAATGSPQRKINTEIMVIALNLVAYNSPSSYQNELVCRPGKWDKETGVCTESVAYVQDVGGTLGGEKARSVPGVPLSEMKNHPRGDWPTFSQDRVFRDAAQCRLQYDIAGVEQLSEAGRKALEQRISGRIGMEELLVIFQKANIHEMDERLTAFAAEQSKLPKGPELDKYVQRMWADAVYARMREVLDARCPA